MLGRPPTASISISASVLLIGSSHAEQRRPDPHPVQTRVAGAPGSAPVAILSRMSCRRRSLSKEPAEYIDRSIEARTDLLGSRYGGTADRAVSLHIRAVAHAGRAWHRTCTGVVSEPPSQPILRFRISAISIDRCIDPIRCPG
jgi:hypothetical protein